MFCCRYERHRQARALKGIDGNPEASCKFARETRDGCDSDEIFAHSELLSTLDQDSEALIDLIKLSEDGIGRRYQNCDKQ